MRAGTGAPGFYDVDGFAVRIRAVCAYCSIVTEGLWNGVGTVTCESCENPMGLAGMGICRAPDEMTADG